MRKLFNNPFAELVFKKFPKSDVSVLMYHRVLLNKNKNVEAGMYVLAETLRMQLDYIRSNFNIIELDQILDSAPVPKNSIAITFDDGWRDNYEFFKDYLKTSPLPITIFLPTNFINTHKRFWTDLIPEYFLNGKLIENYPELNSLPQNEAGISDAINYFKTDLTRLTPELLNATSNERYFMTWEEVHELQSLGVNFGNHTHSHNLANQQTEAEFEADVKKANDILLEKGIMPSKFFCYPSGIFTESSNKVLRKLGFSGFLKTSRTTIKNDQLLEQGRIGIHDDISSGLGSFLFRVLVR